MLMARVQRFATNVQPVTTLTSKSNFTSFNCNVGMTSSVPTANSVAVLYWVRNGRYRATINRALDCSVPEYSGEGQVIIGQPTDLGGVSWGVRVGTGGLWRNALGFVKTRLLLSLARDRSDCAAKGLNNKKSPRITIPLWARGRQLKAAHR